MSLRQVYPKPNPEAVDLAKVDIILVHGLNPKNKDGEEHAFNTWKGKNGRLWPRDDLPKKIPDSRISLYIYDSSAVYGSSQSTFMDKAYELLESIRCSREDCEQRPLILMGHSLGGILIEQALINARQDKTYEHIYSTTACLGFFGTPHEGGSGGLVQAGKIASNVALWLGFQRGDNIIETLDEGSIFTDVLKNHFRQQFEKYWMVSFWGDKDTIVSRDSSRFGLAGHRERIIELKADHSGVAAFGDSQKDEDNLRKVESNVKWLYNEALKQVSMVPNTSTTSYGNIHWMVPCAINNLFTGRAELLLRMQKALHVNHTSSANKQKRFVITGLGGQGKSEICLKVADLMREEFWGIFWVDVGRPATAESDFIAVAKTLGQPVDSVSNALQVLATTKQRWLLILDNADDPDFNYQVYLPSGTQGAIIITSRIPECRQYNTVGAEALEGLKDQYPRELLLKAAEFPPESWSSYNSQAEEVVRLLGSHTLALIQAGAYIAKGHCQLHQYPQFYRRQRKRLLKFRPKQAQSRYCDVYATFEASADVLEQSKSEAAEDALRLLEILSMLDSGILPLRIFEDAWGGGRNVLRTNPIAASAMDALSRGHLSRLPSFVVVDSNEWDPFRLLEASSLLVSLSLVTRHDLDGLPGLSMHPLTHAWAKVRQDLEQQCVAWITTGCVLALSQSNDHTWQTQERRLLPHMQSYLDVEISRVLPFGTEAIVVPILLKCGWNLQGMRQDSKLSHLLEDMFTELRKEPNEPSKESLPLYDLQARSLLNLGKNKKAMELLEQVVKIHKTTLAEDHLDRLASQHELASAYHANGQVKEAVDILEQVVKIQETTLAENHPDRLASQHELACAYHANGQVKEAVDILEQVVKIHKTTLAEDHPHRLASLHELARAYQANGQVKEAVVILEQVVKIEETTLAEDHPDRLASQQALALTYQANGQVKEVVDILEQVVKIKETMLAEDHPNRLASQHVLASAYKANGQVKEAVDILEHVVKIKETTLAEDHPSRLVSQHELARAYKANGQVREAVDILEQVVKIEETTLAEDHPDRLASQQALALTYQANGQVKEAVDILEQVVKIKETMLVEDHPNRLASQHVLASAYKANGQVKEAVDILEHVVKIKETTLAEDHPSRLASQHELARAYKANGQVREAVDILEHVVKIKETTLAEDHPSRLASQHALALAYHANGQVKEGVKVIEQVVKIKQSKLHKSHPSRVISEKVLAYFLREL